jgi:hypothetical protein
MHKALEWIPSTTEKNKDYSGRQGTRRKETVSIVLTQMETLN